MAWIRLDSRSYQRISLVEVLSVSSGISKPTTTRIGWQDSGKRLEVRAACQSQSTQMKSGNRWTRWPMSEPYRRFAQLCEHSASHSTWSKNIPAHHAEATASLTGGMMGYLVPKISTYTENHARGAQGVFWCCANVLRWSLRSLQKEGMTSRAQLCKHTVSCWDNGRHVSDRIRRDCFDHPSQTTCDDPRF
jgi:hypothetical protein